MILHRPLPEPLRPLAELALDLRWTWSHAGDSLWHRVDASLWERTGNPWLMLQLVPAARLEALVADRDFLDELRSHTERRRSVLDAPSWFSTTHGRESARVAYFSMEFGLHEALPLYAGGLGILAGDHLKSASDLGVPLIGVGILWQQGYFRQMVDAAGWQQELFPFNDPGNLPIQAARTADGDRVEVALELPGRQVRLRAWEAIVGRVRLLLLDADHPLNMPIDRGLTGTLYGGGPEIRLLQELILGIGGWRLLRAMGCEVEVCHLNEGHAAFVIIERARTFMQDHGVGFAEALWATRGGNVFTTHTPVAAGFDSFGHPLIETYTAYFDAYVQRLGLTWPDLLAFGRRTSDPAEPFGMAHLALRGSSRVNGVSRLHGEVSRRLFRGLFPRWPEEEVPIVHVTNGVHVPSWDSAGADQLWTAAGGKERWRGEMERLDEAIAERGDEEIWTLRCRERADVVRMARERLHRQLAQRGATGDELAAAETVLDPNALTLGFARRFTAYKRPNLLLRDPDRLRRLLLDPARPVQIVVAGKAHPADGEGKGLIAEWIRFACDPDVRRLVVFLPDYDMALAKELVEGVDVWVNTPRRPLEACGTSGMKVLVNGGLNLSVLDGWWAEAYAPGRGWALGDRHGDAGDDHDAMDAEELYALLETEVVPLFYERDASGLPREWLRRVRTSMAELTARFSGNRMVREYVETMYLPAAADYRARAADGARLATELAAWAARVREVWGSVRFGELAIDVDADPARASVGVALGRAFAGDVRVELFAERRGEERAVLVPMEPVAPEAGHDGWVRFEAPLPAGRDPGDFTPRVVPFHPAARLPLELPSIHWQR
jgi:glycogen phosphorylase